MLAVLPGAPPAPPPPAARPYQPRGGALALFTAHDAEVLIEGPANTGKSRAALEKLHLCCTKYPGIRALVVRQTRESCTESVLVTFETKVVPDGHPILRGPDRASRARYTYPNGSELVVAGLVAHSKDNRAKVMSTEYDLIYVAEATEVSEDDAEKLTTRLRNKRMPYQQIIFDVNPSAPTHWLNQRANRGQTRRILSRHSDNPTFSAQDQAFLDALTGVRRERLRDGRWAAAEGLVYDGYDPAVHLVDPAPIPAEWPRTRALDFGFTNPFVCQWWALSPDDQLVRYRELYVTGRLVTDAAADILTAEILPDAWPVLQSGYAGEPAGWPFLAWARRHHPTAFERIGVTVADHDAEDRATLLRLGIATQKAKKAVGTGIQAVQERMLLRGDGTPGLVLHKGALLAPDPALRAARLPTCTEEELDGYIWEPTADGKQNKETPLKRNDHGCDTMRYAVMHHTRARLFVA